MSTQSIPASLPPLKAGEPGPARVRQAAWPRISVGCLALLVLLLALLQGVDWIFIELNRRGWVLPQFDVSLIPYHDPRVTRRHALLLKYEKPPHIIFTGDSRTKNNVNPEAIARALDVAPELFFNFGTGSQVVRFARRVFLPHLLEMGIRPRYLIFGVSPDWPLDKPVGWTLEERYRSSLAYRLRHPPPERDPLEAALRTGLECRFALFRHRTDLIQQEILPSLECWFLGKCVSTHSTMDPIRPIHWKELERISGIKTPFGWEPQPYDGYARGRFMGKARFGLEATFDEENLRALIRETREAGIQPLFLIMAVHESFREVHEPALSHHRARLERILEEEGAPLLRPGRDYSDPGLFVDGHHMSIRGAAYFSADIAAALKPFLPEGASASVSHPASSAPAQ